ncbi:hypothetical protein AMECASPLE_016568, partial [Ameca splendens]
MPTISFSDCVLEWRLLGNARVYTQPREKNINIRYIFFLTLTDCAINCGNQHSLTLKKKSYVIFSTTTVRQVPAQHSSISRDLALLGRKPAVILLTQSIACYASLPCDQN